MTDLRQRSDLGVL